MAVRSIAGPGEAVSKPAGTRGEAGTFSEESPFSAGQRDLLRELQRTVDELAAFNEIGKMLTGTLDLGEVLRTIMQKVSELLKAENWSLLLVDERTGELHFEAVVGEGAEKIKGLRVQVGEGIAGWVALTGEPVIVPDVSADPRFANRFDQVSDFRTSSVVAVPLRSKERTLGVIELISGRARGDDSVAFSDGDVRTLATLADYAAIAIENARNYQRLQELTVIDDHTGLYNSRHLHRQLESEMARSRRFGHPLSMLFFDLDHFKTVNDTLGHQRGSAVLREVGQLLLVSLRSVDIPVRYGGDEFVVLLPETPLARGAECAMKLQRELSSHRFLSGEGVNLEVTASFGVAAFPDNAKTEQDLLQQADLAMYRAKSRGRNRVEVGGSV